MPPKMVCDTCGTDYSDTGLPLIGSLCRCAAPADAPPCPGVITLTGMFLDEDGRLYTTAE